MNLEDERDLKEDSLREAEEALKIEIPVSLRNVISINGCNNAAVLRDISEADVEEMERFMVSETALDLIPKSEYEQYYGIFYKNPKRFRFMVGHKKLLFLISQFFKRKFQDEKAEPSTEPEVDEEGMITSRSSTQTRISTPSTSSNVPSDNVPLDEEQAGRVHKKMRTEERSQSNTSNFAPNLTKETAQVSHTVKSWIKGKCSTEAQWQHFKEKFSHISFETKLNIQGYLCCTMTCYCTGKYQILKSAQKVNYSERWVYGNLHRHLTKHFNLHLLSKDVSGEACVDKNSRPRASSGPLVGHNRSSDCAMNKVAIKKQQGIMKFITVTKPNTQSEPDQRLSERHAEQDNAGEITKCQTQTQASTNECELAEETIAPAEAGPSRIRILSNEIIVRATVQSESDSEVPLKTLPEKQDSMISPASINQQKPREISTEVSSQNKKKWTSEKYQRNGRARRKREGVKNQAVITAFFPLLKNVEIEVENIMRNDIRSDESESVGARFNATIEAIPQFNGEPSATHRSQLLEMLVDISVQNSGSSSSRYQYNDVVKKFSLYLFYIGGRLLYETIYENMKGVLPSISTLNNYVAKTGEKAEEGIFDYDGLCTFLEDRNLPKVVWISEDGTRVTSKIEYDSKSNKLVGFTLPLVDGLPQTDAFLATSAKAMQDYFLTNSKSNYAYLVMAQPLSKSAPPYCLVVFGTDNKFDSNDVTKRWKHIKHNLKQRGIILLGFSSDGDTRLLKTMRQNASLPTQTSIGKHKWEWYQAGYNVSNDSSEISYVQDTVHIATKLRTRLLNPKIVLTIGSFTVSTEHLERIVADFSKDKHLLTASDLKGEDKMCYRSAEKMCAEPVIQLLEGIPGSEGTRAYLRLMQFATASYLDPALDVRERLYKIWFCVFFLRIWRKWITDHPSLKIGYNFITSNCYLCIELNAHALINICTNFRENPILANDMFLPHLFSSQTCEKTFRATRSMTTTYSTVINFSVKDIIRRLDRIATINNTMNDLRDVLIFPREEKKVTKGLQTMSDLKNLSDESIQTTVEKALHDALEATESLGMQAPRESWKYVAVAITTPIVEDEGEGENDINCDLVVEEDDASDIFNDLSSIQLENNNDICNPVDPLTDTQSQIHTDMCNLSVAGIGEELLLKDFSLKLKPEEDTLCEKGALVRVTVADQKSTVIKKSSLCWLLEETTQKVSTDRLRRFFAGRAKIASHESIISTPGPNFKPRTRIAAKSRKATTKKQNKQYRTIIEECTSDSESSDDKISVKFADSTDTETFSDEMVENVNGSEGDTVNYHNPEMTSSTAETSTFDRNLLSDNLHSLQLECGKFYSIYYEQRWYLGLVTEMINDDYRVRFLRKKRNSEREFFWPKSDDVSQVSREFIFYGPIEVAEVPLQLTDSQLKQINDIYSQMKR